ncbi:MAG TPA: Ig-like domain-containing protein, partial [Candidatus Angelobacter sp.]
MKRIIFFILLLSTTVFAQQYQGYVDNLGCTSFNGWAADRNRLNTSINVEVYDGGTLLGTFPANLSRPDVGQFLGDNGLHGFSIPTPPALKDGLSHQVHVKFETSTVELTNSPAAQTCQPSPNYTGFVDNLGCTSFNGWAADRNRLNTSINVEVYDGSTLLGTFPANLSRPDVGQFLGDNGLHGFSIPTPAAIKDGLSHQVHVKFETSTVELTNSPAAQTCITDVPPVTSITSPTSGATFTAPATITISANASDSDGTVTRVAFFASGTQIGVATTAPYTITWSNVAAGSYSLTSVATDNAGLTATSNPVSIRVNAAAPVDFSTPRVDPSNRTGLPDEDLLSGNYNWSLPLVGLPGRAGLDLNLALSYNSLSVWTKTGSAIDFNADNGFPGPGFQLGFPKIQSKFHDPLVGVDAYLLIFPSGARTELRQVGASNIYESGNSSYIQVVDNGPSGLLARTPDGAQLSYQLTVGEFRCTQVKDRNGNFITVNYNSFGHISTIVDTLGRTVTFNYDASQLNLLQSITQNWNGVQHNWAIFSYGNLTLQTNFPGLTLVGVQNGQNISVPTQVMMDDLSYITFEYTSWGQIFRMKHFAADGHELAHTVYDLPADASTAQTGSPRFTQRRDFAENWNSGTEAVTSFVFDPVNLTGSQMTAPDGTQYKETYSTSTWQRGLIKQTQVISGGAAKKTATISYTQDDPSLAYRLNPRPIETNVTDDAGNHRRTTITYTTFALPSGVNCSLPSDASEYAADATTVLRRTHTDYNLASFYLTARVLGLPATTSIFDGNGVLVSQAGYQYDQGVLDQGAVVQHDDANFGSRFVTGRGNLTTTQHFDVFNTGQFLQSTMAYNTAGSVISQTDPAGRQTVMSYSDSFSIGTAPGQTLAYATSLTDADGFLSTTQYNYDTGAVTLTQDPKGAQQRYTYDAVGRLLQQTYHDSVNNIDGTSTSYIYFAAMNQVQTTTQLDPGLMAASIQLLDGAGRVYLSASNFPGSVGGFRGHKFVYDVMRRQVQQSNPTELDSTYTPAGDDAAGWVFRFQQYDWAGRPTVATNQDLSSSQISYAGCGCAGGLVTASTDEVGRQIRTTDDIFGRPVKTEVLNADRSVYKTTTTVYNVRDQVISSVEQQGSSGTSQTTTLSYDGFGRLASRQLPEYKSGRSTTYSYNSDGTVRSITDPLGNIQNFSYNGRHQVTQLTYTRPDGTQANNLTVSLTYDAAGNRTSMTDKVGSVSYSYDTWSRLLNETRQFNDLAGQSFPISYTYNLAGMLTSVIDPYGAAVSYKYDSAGSLNAVTGAGNHTFPTYVSGAQYRAFGAPKQINYGNGARTAYGYDNRLQVSNFTVVDQNGANFMGSTFGYFADGQPQSVQDIDHTFDRAYVYDQVGRLVSATSGSDAGLGGTAVGPYSDH